MNYDDNYRHYEIPQGDYRLEITHPDFGIVSAETTMPTLVGVTNVAVEELGGSSMINDSLAEFMVTVTFVDPPEDNNYRIECLIFKIMHM